MSILSNLLNEQEKVDIAQGKELWAQRQEAKRKMNNETDPAKRAELQKDFELKDKAYSDYNSPEQRKLRGAQTNDKPADKLSENTEQKPADKPTDKSSENTADKPSENAEQKSVKSSGKPHSLSASFYRDLSANLRNRPAGNTLDVQAATSKEQAQNYKNRSADRQMEAQASQQIANRNEYSEAGKIASMQNNAQNMQNINNLSAAAGNAAALQRKINTPDAQGQQARQDQQRNIANMQREKGNTAQEEVTAESGLSDELRMRSRDHDQDLDEARRLSMGEGIGEEETAQVDSASNASTTENTAETTPANNPDSQITGNPHHILNYVTYGDPKSMNDADRKLYEAWGSPQPLDEATIKAANGNLGVLQQNVMDMRPDFWKKYAESDIGKARGVGTANQRNIGNGLTRDELNNATQTVDLDERIKDVYEPNLYDALSDLRMKFIREDWDNDGCPSEDDFMWLLKKAGKFKNGDMEYDALEDGSDITDQEVLSGYADFIKNYVYNYKPESGENPDVTHIGPMAQDIEQVNPACIKEDENGIKSVDTRRLSMMNAGAIGELARQLQDISDRLSKAGI